MSFVYSSRPLDWSEYLQVMMYLGHSIHGTDNLHQKKYAAVQTLVSLGVHLGPQALELLSIRWSEVIHRGAYIFANESHRQPLVLEPYLIQVIKRNYKLIKPASPHCLIMTDNLGAAGQAIQPRRFNNILADVFKTAGINVDAPSSNTLRRTFARKIWLENGKSEDIIDELSNELRLGKGGVRRYIEH